MARNTQIQIRERVIKFSEEGKSSREIASLLSIGKSTLNDIIVKYRSGYGLKDRPRSGRPRKTSKKLDRIIKCKSTADVKKTAVEIARELKDENLANVSRSTVTRRLHDVGLFGRIGIKKPLISKKNKKTRLQLEEVCFSTVVYSRNLVPNVISRTNRTSYMLSTITSKKIKFRFV